MHPFEYDSADFLEFCKISNNRLVSLKNLLLKNSIDYSQISLASNTHIVLKLPACTYSPQFKIKTLIAHYDRTPGSQGANDNAAAIFQILHLAKEICDKKEVANIRIIFTGGEELQKGDSIKQQGAFSLGQGLKTLKCQDDEIFVLDCCGRGDTLIVSETGILPTPQAQKLHKTAITLCQNAVNRLNASIDATSTTLRFKTLTLKVPYGDNAGLSLAGLPCQAITVLPYAEAQEVQAATATSARPATLKMCPTWKLINSSNDVPNTLTTTSLPLMHALLQEIKKRLALHNC